MQCTTILSRCVNKHPTNRIADITYFWLSISVSEFTLLDSGYTNSNMPLLGQEKYRIEKRLETTLKRKGQRKREMEADSLEQISH